MNTIAAEMTHVAQSAQHLEEELQTAAAEKETALEAVEAERQARITAEGRLRVAETALVRLDRALRESGVKMDVGMTVGSRDGRESHGVHVEAPETRLRSAVVARGACPWPAQPLICPTTGRCQQAQVVLRGGPVRRAIQGADADHYEGRPHGPDRLRADGEGLVKKQPPAHLPRAPARAPAPARHSANTDKAADRWTAACPSCTLRRGSIASSSCTPRLVTRGHPKSARCPNRGHCRTSFSSGCDGATLQCERRRRAQQPRRPPGAVGRSAHLLRDVGAVAETQPPQAKAVAGEALDGGVLRPGHAEIQHLQAACSGSGGV